MKMKKAGAAILLSAALSLNIQTATPMAAAPDPGAAQTPQENNESAAETQEAQT